MTKTLQTIETGVLALAAIVMAATVASAQVVQRPGVPAQLANKQPTPTPVADPNFIIGPDDVLVINVLNEKLVSGEVIVRPDGKITLPLGNDIVASGLTTVELKAKVVEELKKGGFFEDPTVFIQVKTINSRKVCVVGLVAKQGCMPLTGPMDVLELISLSGGLQEFADKKNLVLVSGSLKGKDGKPATFKINYQDMSKGVNLDKYNLPLRPGDKLIVK